MRFILILLLLTLICCSEKEEAQYDLVIYNVNLIDGVSDQIQVGKNVYIKGNSIHSISSDEPALNEKIIDGSGKYLIPGLFDCHIHTTDYKSDFPKFMHYGVTSVFITGGSICTNENYQRMREMGEQDSLPSPRVFHTSQHFSMEGRHPSKTYPSNDWKDGETIFFLKDTVQIKQLVEQVAQYPIVGIKLTIEDGPAPPFVDRIPQSFINKTVDEASKHGLEVFAHVSDNEELRMAIEGGVQNLVHYTGVNVDFNDPSHLSLLNKLIARNPSWITTLMIDKSFIYPIYPEWFNNKYLLPEYVELQNSISPGLVKRAESYLDILKEDYGVSESSVEAFFKPQAEDINELSEMGFNMVLGTDTGNTFIFPGYGLHEEMELLEMGGLKPMDILKMGTINAAKMLKVSEKLGSIEEGKLADMILLDQNPLDSIKNTLTINTIIKNGRIQKRIADD